MPTYVKPIEEAPSPSSERFQSMLLAAQLVKGQLNKIRSRLPVLGQQQESSRVAMSMVQTYKVLHGAVAGGPFVVGEVLSGAISLATGSIVSVGNNELVYTPLIGSFAVAEMVTGGTTGASALIVSLTTPLLVGQIVKIPEDNISGLLLTVESQVSGTFVDQFEASQANLQLVWPTAGVAALQDTTIFFEGAASLKLDHSVGSNIYTYTVSSLSHGPVTGSYQLNETVTGGTSGATGVIEQIGTSGMTLTAVAGLFVAGEVLTGGTSGATSTTSSGVLISADWRGFDVLALDIYISTKPEQTLLVGISDGVNTATQSLTGVVQGWASHRIDLATLAASGGPAPVNLAAVTQVTLQPTTKSKTGYYINVDNMRLLGTGGNLGLRFYDMGAGLPVSGVATLAGGTVKALGDLGIVGSASNLITYELKGGKELVRIQEFSHGAAKEMPANTLLTPGNYYAIVAEYVDVDVTIYGADPALAMDYYQDGYAFTTPDTATALTSLGVFHDCMFMCLTAQDVWVKDVSILSSPEPGGGEFILVVEDTNMKMRVIARGLVGELRTNFSLHSPVYMPAGGKLELYYMNTFSSRVQVMGMSVGYWSAKYDSYVVDP